MTERAAPGPLYSVSTRAHCETVLRSFYTFHLEEGTGPIPLRIPDGHFTCARAYGTACIHEHACVRCSRLRPDPAQRDLVVEVRGNLIDRITQAEQQGQHSEIEGLRVSLSGAPRSVSSTQRPSSADQWTSGCRRSCIRLRQAGVCW
ncbi:hypothetical protein DDE74_36610 [Streptomyces lydicus]|uniref:Uncharacterized protein n=1 Tax=Streptomyces lydicus TaxID=47763 RepID=A0A3S9YLG2_9ACTN|nr:hypothetical protein [Streptomyces lydicus]AZS75688.1 hypothetical protein DDE74_36610 [Streptomyces lydicus]